MVRMHLMLKLFIKDSEERTYVFVCIYWFWDYSIIVRHTIIYGLQRTCTHAHKQKAKQLQTMQGEISHLLFVADVWWN